MACFSLNETESHFVVIYLLLNWVHKKASRYIPSLSFFSLNHEIFLFSNILDIEKFRLIILFNYTYCDR